MGAKNSTNNPKRYNNTQYSEFSVRAIPNDVSWYAVYSAFRRYAAITQIRSGIPSAQPQRFIDRLFESLGQPKKATFILQRTSGTDSLKSSQRLKCGLVSVPIKWERDMKIKSSSPIVSAPSIASAQNRRGGILDVLNDDCIYEMLSQNILCAADLCAIYGTCTRFNNIAWEAFRSRFAKSKIRLNTAEWTVELSESLFLNFGPVIESIHLGSSEVYGDVVLGFVAKYCPNIRELVCHRMNAMAPAINSYKRLHAARRRKIAAPFGQLQRLENHAPRLPSPNMMDIRLPAIHLPNLRHFELSRAWLNESADVERFFGLNNQLQVLRMEEILLPGHINNILKHQPNITELHALNCRWRAEGGVEVESRNVGWHFGHLTRLSKFKVQVFHVESAERVLVAMIEAGIQVKSLEVRVCQFPTGLELLEALFAFDVTGIMAAVERMPTVEELQLIGFKMDIEPLTRFVQARPHLQLTGHALTGRRPMDGFKTRSFAGRTGRGGAVNEGLYHGQ